MAAQTTMIIVTSNEDIIQQLSLHNAPNTRVIELDDNTPGTSLLTGDNNMPNFGFLAELSQLNCTNDELYKRALHSLQHHSSKPAKVQKKSADLICAICGDRTIGYNYDVPSCASCKAFFSRNANQTMDKIRCLTGESQCSVADEIRPKCRLERCLAAGMRKDFVLSDEMKQRRKKRSTEMRSITSQSTNALSNANLAPNFESPLTTSDEIDRLLINTTEDNQNILFDENDDLNQMGHLLLETLSIDDWITVESIRSSFLTISKNDIERRPSTEPTDRISALINWSYIANQNCLRFITFYRQIPEFEHFDGDDRLLLIKYNLFPLYPILKCFYYNPETDGCSNGNNEEETKHHRLITMWLDPNSRVAALKIMARSLIQLTERDPAILSFLLVVLMFPQGLSMNEDEPSLKDPLAVNRAQSFYTKVLWNYMRNKWGEMETSIRFSRLLTLIFQMQSSAKSFGDYFRTQFTTTEDVDKLAPLIQTILNIS